MTSYVFFPKIMFNVFWHAFLHNLHIAAEIYQVLGQECQKWLSLRSSGICVVKNYVFWLVFDTTCSLSAAGATLYVLSPFFTLSHVLTLFDSRIFWHVLIQFCIRNERCQKLVSEHIMCLYVFYIICNWPQTSIKVSKMVSTVFNMSSRAGAAATATAAAS